MSGAPPPTCAGPGCSNPGTYFCARCKIPRFCSTSCQNAVWQEHKLVCRPPPGKTMADVQKPYKWQEPSLATPIPFLVTDFQAGPNQDMDPPDLEDSMLYLCWQERPFTLNGKVLFTASCFPPEFKALIQQGLRDKRLTWTYLNHDAYVYRASYSFVPVEDLMLFTRQIIAAHVKPKATALMEIFVEHFWRTRGIVGQLDYNPAVKKLLDDHKIQLPFTTSGMDVDDFRLLTHLSGCGCYHCLARPYQVAKKREAWERARLREARKGRFMLSWESMQEYIHTHGADAADQLYTVNWSNWSTWTCEADDLISLDNVSKSQKVAVCAKLDQLIKERRIPTHSELDVIFAIFAGPKTVPTTSTSTASTAPGRTPAAYSSAKSIFDHGTSHRMAVVQLMIEDKEAEAEEAVTATAARAAAKAHKSAAASAKATATTSTAATSSAGRPAPPARAAAAASTASAASAAAADDNSAAPLSASGRPQRWAAMQKVSYAVGNASSSSGSEAGGAGEPKLARKLGAAVVNGEGSDASSGWSSSNGDASSSTESSSDEEEYDISDEENEGDDDDDYADGRAAVGAGAGAKGAARFANTGGASKKACSSSGATKADGGGGMKRWGDDTVATLLNLVDEFGVGKWAAMLATGRLPGWSTNDLERKNRQLQSVSNPNNTHITEEEMPDFLAAIEEFTGRGRGGNIDMTSVGVRMGGRDRAFCSNEYQKYLSSQAKKGPFTDEEDALILRRVREAGPKLPRDFWKKLGIELGGRHGNRVTMRWHGTLSKRK